MSALFANCLVWQFLQVQPQWSNDNTFFLQRNSYGSVWSTLSNPTHFLAPGPTTPIRRPWTLLQAHALVDHVSSSNATSLSKPLPSNNERGAWFTLQSLLFYFLKQRMRESYICPYFNPLRTQHTWILEKDIFACWPKWTHSRPCKHACTLSNGSEGFWEGIATKKVHVYIWKCCRIRAQSLLLGQRCTRTFLLRATSRVILVNILFRFLIFFYDRICFSIKIPFKKCAGCPTSCEQQQSYGKNPARGKFVWKLVCP